MREFIKENKGYVFRSLGNYLLAVPSQSKCWVHELEKGETHKEAFKRLKKEVGKPYNKPIKIWDIPSLGETLEDIMKAQLLVIKYIKSLKQK